MHKIIVKLRYTQKMVMHILPNHYCIHNKQAIPLVIKKILLQKEEILNFN